MAVSEIERPINVISPPPTANGHSDKRLKVTYIVSRFPNLTETFVLYEILVLREQGVDVELFPLHVQTHGVMHQEARALLDQVYHIPRTSHHVVRANWRFLQRNPDRYVRAWWEILRGTWRRPWYLVGALYTVPMAATLAHHLLESGVDHIHAHFANHPAVAALVVHRLLGVPFSFTAHGSHDIFVNQTMLREKILRASRVITVSQYNRDFIARRCGEDLRDRIEIVRCGTDTTLFKPSDEPTQPRPFTIVCVASLEEWKGQAYLIEACRLLAQRGVEFRCHLIGQGSQRDQIARQIARAGLVGRVILEGACRRDQVLAFLQRADVAVQPSVPTANGWAEGIPVALMEAMACGVPVVASRLTGIPELVRHDDTGLLAPPRDSVALAGALARLNDDPAMRQRLARAGRSLVLQEYDLRRNAARLGELFAKLAESRRAIVPGHGAVGRLDEAATEIALPARSTDRQVSYPPAA